MIVEKKTFADMKVGETLYFGCLDSYHIMESRLVSIEMLPDNDNCYTHSSDIRFTPVEFGNFAISKMILDRHDVIYYTHNNQGFWCGTSKEAVAEHVIAAIKSKIDFWYNRMIRFNNNNLY